MMKMFYVLVLVAVTWEQAFVKKKNNKCFDHTIKMSTL